MMYALIVLSAVCLGSVVKMYFTVKVLTEKVDLLEHKIEELKRDTTSKFETIGSMSVKNSNAIRQNAEAISENTTAIREMLDMDTDDQRKFMEGYEAIMNYSLATAKGKK